MFQGNQPTAARHWNV